MPAIKITDEHGYIVDRAVREAYERICDAPGNALNGGRAAEAFLKLVERYAARGVRLLPELKQR